MLLPTPGTSLKLRRVPLDGSVLPVRFGFHLLVGFVVCLNLILPGLFFHQEIVPTYAAAPAEKTEESPVPPAEKPASPAVKESEPLPWTLRPYDVEVIVSLSHTPALSHAIRADLMQQLQETLKARYGGMWNLNLRQVLEEISAENLASLSDSDAERLWLEIPADKVFRLRVEEQGGQWHLAAREWDRSTRTLNTFLQQTLEDRRNLVPELTRLVSDSFRPLVEIDVIEPEKIECLVRAGEYPSRNVEDSQFFTGDLLVPCLRYLDRDQSVRKIQMVPWTWLQVATIERARMELTVNSAFRSPLPMSRRRVEVLAMRVRPLLPASEVLIYPRGNKSNPLVGVRCEVNLLDSQAAKKKKNKEEAQAETKPLELITDRQGKITIPVQLDHPLRTLQVQSGEAVLARVPIMPGGAPLMELEVPDDQARLQVEGEVQLLEVELVDIVATREVLIARAQVAADKQHWEDVDRFLSELQSLPTQDQFLAQIQTLEVQAVHAAKLARDRVAESRIKRLCKSIRDSASKHLDSTRTRYFLQDINSQRRQQ